ncbi:MAG: bifunctional riboflavin kinase/FAD synthetase [bacterium]
MNISWDTRIVNRNPNNVLTVGTFDGVHTGHRYILESLHKRAEEFNAQTTLVTFNPHPQLVLRNPDKPELKILTTVDEKIEILRSLNLDNLIVIPFTRDFADTTSSDFVTILFEQIGCREIVIGYDHGFGRNRQGNVETLLDMGRKLGFSVQEVTGLMHNGETISSTRIRKSLLQGSVKEAGELLGYRYFLTGIVVKGEGRGKTFDYPTANIEPQVKEKLIPGDGVYAVYVSVGEQQYRGMMNIGNKPTFSSAPHSLEIHIFDFNRDIYGEKIKISFEDRIRDEIKFSNVAELQARLSKDKEMSLRIL